MNKKSKILMISLLTTSSIFVPALVTTSIILNKDSHLGGIKYNFLDQQFDSKEDIINYANGISTMYSRTTNTPIKWSMNVNGELLTFDNQIDVENYLDKFITPKSYTSYTNNFKTSNNSDFEIEDYLKTDAIGALLPSELSKMNFDENTNIQTVYRGKNNSIHLTEKAAKDSYFQFHEVYYFNGIFFRAKEELANWLEKNISNLKDYNSKVYEISFCDMNDKSSLPINVEQLKQEYDSFENNDNLLNKSKIPSVVEHFVRTKSKCFFEYYDDTLNKNVYISESSIDKLNNIYDANYTKITSNQNKGNYIVDTSKEDEADFFGPYYVKSGSEIEQITNTSKWRRIEGTDHAIVNQVQKNELFMRFMNLIFVTPPSEFKEFNITPSPNAMFEIPDLQNNINKYFDNLAFNLPKVFNSLKNLYETMKKGKRYNEFLKLPILFMHTIDQIIYYSEPQEYIDLTREIYSKICDYFDRQIYSIIPKSFLQHANGKTYFSLKEYFEIENKMLDLNYDLETLTSRIEIDYPKLYPFINFIINLEKINYSMNSLEGLNLGYKGDYELVLNVLNSNSIESLYENIDKINPELEIKIPYYYINNFYIKMKSRQIAKVAISFWLNQKETINKYNLTNKQIIFLNSITKESRMNTWFPMKEIIKYTTQTTGRWGKVTYKTITYGPPFLESNKKFLKELWENCGDVDPDLFYRLILFMHYHNNSVPLSKYFSNSFNKLDETRASINNFVSNNIVRSSSNRDKYQIKLFNRHNSNLDIIYVNESNKNESKVIQPIMPDFPNLPLGDKTEKFLECVKEVRDSLSTLSDKVNEVYDSQSDKAASWGAAQLLLSTLSQVMKLVAFFSPLAIAVSALFDLFANLWKIDNFSYIFETKDNKFIWNGGMQESWFFGMIPGKSTTIEDMKILKPVEVIKPNKNEGYYYDGSIYGDLSLLKRKQLNDILVGRYSSNELKKVYSLINLEKEDNNYSKFYDYSINELMSKFSNHVKEIITNDNFEEDKIVKKSSLKFDSFKYDNYDTIKGNTDKVLEQIKPTLVAQIPILNPYGHKLAGTPISNDYSDIDDNSLSEYKLPGKSWTSNGGIRINNDDNFIIVDQNPVNKSIVDYKEKLYEEFYNSFKVDSREVDIDLIKNINLFSDLSKKIESNYCYFTVGKDNETNIFLNKNDAINWLMDEFEFKTYYKKEITQNIFIDDLVFTDYNEYINWVYSNIWED